MNYLINYCKRKNYKLKLILDKDRIQLTITDENWNPIYYAEANVFAFNSLIRELKTRINLDSICGDKTNAN